MPQNARLPRGGARHSVLRPKRRRMMAVEALTDRNLFATDFCNSFNEFDVNDDGVAAPLDVLLIVGALNEGGSRKLTDEEPASGRFYDVSDDQFLTPHDALLVINHLNEYTEYQVPLVFGLAPASDPNGNGVVLTSNVTVAGQTAPGARLRLTRSAADPIFTSADAHGRFQFSLSIDLGDTIASPRSTSCAEAL
jgi:hypothetical protein